MGPYIPSSPVKDLSGQEVADGPQYERLDDRNREMEEAVWTTGEVHFGSAESADGPTNPSPTTIQLERNRSDLAPDRTDDKGNPTSAESMETAELNEFDPLADCQLDMAEDYLSPITGNISQDTGSSDISENPPNQYTGSLDKQETGSPERQVQTSRKPRSSFLRPSAHRSTRQYTQNAAIYPNFGSISPIIITENKRREQLPMLNLDAMEESDRLERGDRETTITCLLYTSDAADE